MKTTLIPLIGDPIQNLYQLGLKEKDSFLALEDRIKKLTGANALLRHGQDLAARARILLRKGQNSFFEQCISSYAEGMGIEAHRYHSFLSLLEVAAHYGQVYPELKSIIPGCTSVFSNEGGDYRHTRLMDFPLIGIFEAKPRLYFWQPEGRGPLLSYSCEGLAPLFFQGIHGAGVSFAVHHKPGTQFHSDGQGIFQIAFETFFEATTFADVKKDLKRRVSMTKWSVLMLEKSGQVFALDLDGPAQHSETYHLGEVSPVVFSNIPLQNDATGFENYLGFCRSRESWVKGKLTEKSDRHILDRLTDVGDQKQKNWTPPAGTLATVAAWSVNLTKGILDVKEGEAALTTSDPLFRVALEGRDKISELKAPEKHSPFELAWKRASKAQAAFDQGGFAEAYHELQMAQALMPSPLWKEIFTFYLFLWDFKFIGNNKELSLVYKKVKALRLPESMKDQKAFLIMRLEKKLELSPTVGVQDVSPGLQKQFQEEKLASKPVFATWMKLIYPRLEILDVFSPHHRS